MAGVGSPRLVTGGAGRMTTLGDGTKNPTMNNYLNSLAPSIKWNGRLQPILVCVHPRWAAGLAGLDSTPAVSGKHHDDSALAVTTSKSLSDEHGERRGLR